MGLAKGTFSALPGFKIGSNGNGFPILGIDRRHDLIDLIGTIYHRQVRSFLSGQFSDSSSYTLSGTGDDYHLVGEALHAHAASSEV
jgi:hypothetical protein